MNPYIFGLYGWRESTTVHVTFKKVTKNSPREEMLNLKGELCISMIELIRSVVSLKGKNRAKFIYRLIQSVIRTYILQIPRGRNKFFASLEIYQGPYPSSILHEIKTGNGNDLRKMVLNNFFSMALIIYYFVGFV